MAANAPWPYETVDAETEAETARSSAPSAPVGVGHVCGMTTVLFIDAA